MNELLTHAKGQDFHGQENRKTKTLDFWENFQVKL